MPLYFDHIVLKVSHLNQAIDDFEKEGFKVVRGGVHHGGLSENALIFFEDDSFIELFCLTRGLKVAVVKALRKFKFFKYYQYSKKWGLAYRFYSRAIELPDGVTDVCFLSDNYSGERNRIHSSGIFLTGSLVAGRKRPDGSRSKWEMSCPYINELPFIRSPYVPSTDIDNNLKQHENGVKGIKCLKVIALDYKDMVSKYESFLGFSSKAQSGNDKGQKASFDLKNTRIELFKSSEHKDLQEKLRGKGIGMYGVSFLYDDHHDDRKEFDLTRLHGLAITNKEG